MSQTRNLSVYSAACALEESLAALAAQVLLRLYCKAIGSMKALLYGSIKSRSRPC